MKNVNIEEQKIFSDIAPLQTHKLKKKIDYLQNKNYGLAFILIILSLINLVVIINKFSKRKYINKFEKKEIKFNQKLKEKKNNYDFVLDISKKEKYNPHLEILNKKRTFEQRYPLSKEINCTAHFNKRELIAFLSFLTSNTTYFETGSGCSSIIAKYYTKKSYAVEGCKKFYEIGIKNGLKNNLLFYDLKPDNPIWSYPGKKSTIDDWKKYFQSYNKSYNADVILIDGRFKVATAMDIILSTSNHIIFIQTYYVPVILISYVSNNLLLINFSL